MLNTINILCMQAYYMIEENSVFRQTCFSIDISTHAHSLELKFISLVLDTCACVKEKRCTVVISYT